MSLLDTLKERFKVEQTEYGTCLIIPKKQWTELPVGWEQQLAKEGVKVFSQSWNGEAAFFIKLAAVKLRKRRWTEEDNAKLKTLYGQNYGIGTIAKELGRTYPSTQHQIERLGLPIAYHRTVETHVADPTPKPSDNVVANNNEVVKEFLSACSLLYPTHKTACAFLLKEASNKILAEAKVN